MNRPNHLRDSFTVAEAARILALGERSLLRLVRAGVLDTVKKPGLARRVTREAMERVAPGCFEDQLIRCTVAAEIINMSLSTVYRYFWDDRLQGVLYDEGLLGTSATVRIFKGSAERFRSARDEKERWTWK